MKRQQTEIVADILSRCRGSLLAVALFSLFINLLMLVAPLYILQIFDRVLNTGSRETLFYLTVFAAVRLSLWVCWRAFGLKCWSA